MTSSSPFLLEQLQTEKAAPGNWLHVVTHLDPKYGGLSSVVPQLCSSVAAIGEQSIQIAAFCRPDDTYKPTVPFPVTLWPASRAAWLRRPDVRARFRETIRAAEGVHIHGLWEQSTAIAARIARSVGKPYIVSAHGMLEPWALANKKWKKRLYAAAVEHANVDRAACLHALTQAEARNYRDFGSRAPIVVIPNAVEIPATLDPEPFLTQFPALRGKRIVLFLGRIHFKKGLDLLVKSWAALAKKWPDTYLVVAGPDSENTQAAVEQLVHDYGLGKQVLFTGMLQNQMKWSALAAAECFVLPSYSEGLSTSVLEAMGAGLPVIVTRHCNLPEVKIYETGWQIESNLDDLTFSLSGFLEGSADTNQSIGARGSALVRERYNWTSVARQMSEVYGWIAGGPRPRHVELLMA